MSEQHPNLRRLATGITIEDAVAEILRSPELWKLLEVRQQYEGSAHVDTETIVLRGPTTLEKIFDNLDCVDFEVTRQLPSLLSLIRSTAEFLSAREAGRLMLVRLKADGWIRPHVDEGAYARYFARFHLVLQSNPRCLFQCGEETVHMAPGELWWFNHQVEHSVLNKGAARIHLIMDFTAPGFTGALEHIRVPG